MIRCLQGAHVPEKTIKGKTPLIQKEPGKGTALNNYRPITYLPMMWNILTAQKRGEIYHSLTSHGLFPEEQKRSRKRPRGTAGLLYIGQHYLNKNKTRRKNLAMLWIVYKRAYDVVSPSWLINCLKMYKISHEVMNFIENTMKTWTLELTAGGGSSVEAKIQRRIFQDSLSPLLLFTNPSARAGYDTRSIFKRSLTGFNLEFSFS